VDVVFAGDASIQDDGGAGASFQSCQHFFKGLHGGSLLNSLVMHISQLSLILDNTQFSRYKVSHNHLFEKNLEPSRDYP
jgi:hypothetical protein